MYSPKVCWKKNWEMSLVFSNTHKVMKSTLTGLDCQCQIAKLTKPVSSRSSAAIGTRIPSTKSPQMNILCFDGDLTKWQMFWQLFNAFVHTYTSLLCATCPEGLLGQSLISTWLHLAPPTWLILLLWWNSHSLKDGTKELKCTCTIVAYSHWST